MAADDDDGVSATASTDMEHAYDTLDGGPPPFLPSISDFWHPSFSPSFEAGLSGWSLAFYLLFRKLLVFLLLPIRLILVLCHVPGVPSRQTWSIRQKIALPFLNHVVWTIRGLGAPAEVSYEARRDVAPSVERKYGAYRRSDGHMVTVEQLDFPLMDAERRKRWYLPASEGGVLDPTGVVQPERVPCFAFWREPLQTGGTGFSLSRPGETVILYLIGGGYVEGTPLEERVWKVCRSIGLRIIAPNYRHATSPQNAFPAALQDALLTYAHMVDKLRIKNIILMGDSAGGGLCLALAQALSRLPEAKTDPALTPTHIVLHSPFVNLVDFNTPSFQRNQDVDMLNLGMVTMSSNCVAQNLLKNPLPAKDPNHFSPWHPTQLRRHPYLSPALESSVASIAMLRQTARTGGPKIMITWGTAELFADACQQMVDTLKKAGWTDDELLLMPAEDLTHVWIAYPDWLAPMVKEMWAETRRFLGVKEIPKAE